MQEAKLFQAGPRAGDASHELSVFAHRRAFRVQAADGRRDFWRRVGSGLWEPQTFEVFERFLRPDRSYVDIGAWIGPTVLYGAMLSRRAHGGAGLGPVNTMNANANGVKTVPI